MKPRLLIVEDDAVLADGLKKNFEYEGFDVLVVGDGIEAARCIPTFKPDVILLDIRLPKLDGFAVLELLRERGVAIPPVVILSAKTEPEDVVRGFNLGAVDYVEKPFNTIKLIASVNSRLPASKRVKLSSAVDLPVEVDGRPGLRVDRRTGCVYFGSCCLDPTARRFFRAGQEFGMRPRVFDLLLAFLRHAGEVVTRKQLFKQVWGVDAAIQSRTVDMHVYLLRRKIELDPKHPQHLVTIPRVGYRLDAIAGSQPFTD